MKTRPKDRHLDVPAEANTDKHINFEALENNGKDAAATGETESYYNKNNHLENSTFHLLVDNVPYTVKVVPFPFNDDTRFYISINGGTDHVFAWDPQMKRLRAIDDEAAMIPSALEDAINEKLIMNAYNEM
ncbi:MAG: hypothetical protein JWP81_3395 [Ferruginibacter sp.]|nr:hypothetical protein [Ferruginibacter sp.]